MEDSCGELLKRREVELDFRRNLFSILLCLFYGNVSPGSRLDHDILAWIMTFLHGPLRRHRVPYLRPVATGRPPAYGGMFDFRRNLFVARWQKMAWWHGAWRCSVMELIDGNGTDA